MNDRRDPNYLLQALEATTKECRRLENRVRELEGILALEEEVKYEQENYARPRRNRRQKPKFRRETPELSNQPLPLVETASRRNVNDVYREQKEKHEKLIASQRAKELAEQVEIQEELAEEATKNKKPVDVQLSESKKRLLIETSKAIMTKAGK